MKIKFFSLALSSVLALPSFAFAGGREADGLPPPDGSQSIYEALKVREVDVTPRGLQGSATVQKSVGGLICHKRQPVVPVPVAAFECSLSSRKNDQAIYESLSIEEVNVTPEGLLGSTTLEKSIAGLSCRKSEAVVLNPVPNFQCSLR